MENVGLGMQYAGMMIRALELRICAGERAKTSSTVVLDMADL